jgi:hypothetical protein
MDGQKRFGVSFSLSFSLSLLIITTCIFLVYSFSVAFIFFVAYIFLFFLSQILMMMMMMMMTPFTPLKVSIFHIHHRWMGFYGLSPKRTFSFSFLSV